VRSKLSEDEVIDAIKKWIKTQHPELSFYRSWTFDIIAGPSEMCPGLLVECKGNPSQRFKAQRAIGQCLEYTAFLGVMNTPCFIAIPENFAYKDLILQTLKDHKLPIGLLVVGDKGEVKVLRKWSRKKEKKK